VGGYGQFETPPEYGQASRLCCGINRLESPVKGDHGAPTSSEERQGINQAKDQDDDPHQLLDAGRDADEKFYRIEQQPDAAADNDDSDRKPEYRDGKSDHGEALYESWQCRDERKVP
jgi:hypothetical protein